MILMLCAVDHCGRDLPGPTKALIYPIVYADISLLSFKIVHQFWELFFSHAIAAGFTAKDLELGCANNH